MKKKKQQKYPQTIKPNNKTQEISAKWDCFWAWLLSILDEIHSKTNVSS